MTAFQCAFPHCFTTNVTATAIAASFIPSSPLHFLTVSAIPPCLGDTFPKFGDLFSHRGVGNNLGFLICDFNFSRGTGKTEESWLANEAPVYALLKNFSLTWTIFHHNRTIIQMPQCTCPVSRNTHLRTEMCTFLFSMVYHGICERGIMGFMKFVYSNSMGHYSDVIMTRWRLKSPASCLFTQPFVQAHIKKVIKAPLHWSSCMEFTGDQWIPSLKGLWRGKCFHLMTSSWLGLVVIPSLVITLQQTFQHATTAQLSLQGQHSVKV